MTAQHETQKLSHSQQLSSVGFQKMRGKSVSQLESALPLCWDNPFLIISSAHHHSTSQTWSQQHRIYWLYLIFLIFNYQLSPRCTLFVRSLDKSRVTLFITTAQADITGVSQHLPPVCPQFVQSPVSPRSHPVIPVTISDPGSFFCVLLERMLSVGGVDSCLEKYPQSDWLSPPCVVSVTWWEEKTPDGGWQEQHVNPPLPSPTLHPFPALQNLVIFALGLEPAHLLPYFKYLHQNCPAVLTPREVPCTTG